jgi:hypothetical protein
MMGIPRLNPPLAAVVNMLVLLMALLVITNACQQNQIVIDSEVKTDSMSVVSGDMLAERLNQYQTWLRDSGLPEIFEIKEKPRFYRKKLVLILHSGHLEDAHHRFDSSGQTVLDSLIPFYLKLYSKLVYISGLPIDSVELHIRGYSGYCNPSTVVKIIRVTNGGIRFEQEVISPTFGILCSLNFFAIEKLERKLREGIAEAEKTIAISNAYDVKKSEQLSLSRLRNFFESHYAKKQGEVTFTNVSDDLLTFVVRKLRGEVILQGRFWEKFQVFLTAYPYESEFVKFHLVLDGQYASGLTPPSDQAYSDMEPTYTSSLREYGEKVMVHIRSSLK